ncbi:hypothetical protein ABFA07_017242 [Porites harrisoni]
MSEESWSITTSETEDDGDVLSSFIEVPYCSAASPVDGANSTTETASGAHGYLHTPVHADVLSSLEEAPVNSTASNLLADIATETLNGAHGGSPSPVDEPSSDADDRDVLSSFIEVPDCSAASPVDGDNSTTETASGAHGYLHTPVHADGITDEFMARRTVDQGLLDSVYQSAVRGNGTTLWNGEQAGGIAADFSASQNQGDGTFEQVLREMDLIREQIARRDREQREVQEIESSQLQQLHTARNSPIQNCVLCGKCVEVEQQNEHQCHPNNCSICLEPVDDFTGNRELPCGHEVHVNCYILMLQKDVQTCPLCRRPIH